VDQSDRAEDPHQHGSTLLLPPHHIRWRPDDAVAAIHQHDPSAPVVAACGRGATSVRPRGRIIT
jgi:hypothetical protein